MKKKKIEVITLHRIVNYGSVLQAYATQYIMEKIGFNVEFVDYYPERMHILGMLKRIKGKNEKLKKSFLLRTLARIIIFPSYLKRFYVFKKFIKEKLNLSKTVYKTKEQLEKDIPQADFYCTGSDQVWNTGWNEKIDEPFFLNFAPKDKICFSYASSFGKSQLEEWEKKKTKELLGKYKYLAMREKSGVQILNDLGIKEGINVLDPTLLLTKDDWNSLISDKYKNKKYIFMYNINRNAKLDEYAKKLSKKKKIPVITVSYQFHDFFKFGKVKVNPKVQDFLSLIANAEYVLTDSFHCTAFSINFNKNVLIAYPEKFSTRLASIVEITGLTNRVIDDYDDISICERNINFDYANEQLKKERDKSIQYIKMCTEI